MPSHTRMVEKLFYSCFPKKKKRKNSVCDVQIREIKSFPAGSNPQIPLTSSALDLGVSASRRRPGSVSCSFFF